MKFGNADFRSRLARKAVYRHAAKVLQAAIKTDDPYKISHIEQLIAELQRRGKLSPCLIREQEERRYADASRNVQEKGNISEEEDGRTGG